MGWMGKHGAMRTPAAAAGQRATAALCGVLLASVLAPAGAAAVDAVPAEALEQARAFVDGEFRGVLDMRIDHAVIERRPAPRTASGEQPGLLDGRVIDLAADPLVAVSDYRIGEARRLGDTIEVTVDYAVVAATAGRGLPGRRFIRATSAQERTALRMVQHGQRWQVERPPLPRVSSEVLLETLAGQLAHARTHVLPLPQTSRAQRATFAALEAQLGQLRGLITAQEAGNARAESPGR